jgi:4'-phosphopantetheinyl transferase
LELDSHEIHLWLAFPDEIQDADLLLAYEQMMMPEERTRQQRFHFAKHRHQHLITRALVRTTLSRYANIEPHNWRFSKNDYGRPEIILQKGVPPLRFNLSHTDGLIICGVVLEQDIGVDVENMKRKGETVEIADRFFSQKEVEDLHAVPSANRQARFFDYWTLKESYIKARGMGLSLPLEQFTFHISENEPLRISFDSRLHDEPNKWQFWLLRPTPHHKMAISVCQQTNKHIRLVIKKVVPLKSVTHFPQSCIAQSSTTDLRNQRIF